MKKTILIALTVFLAGCSAKYTPDFILKHSDKQAYAIQEAAKQCQTYNQSRVIQIDGVAGFYDYNGNYSNTCIQAELDTLQPYQNPERHAIHRDDIRPLGRTN